MGLVDIEISIHAPREGSDPAFWWPSCRHGHFYPRSPRGERQESNMIDGWDMEFLSTLPARGATQTRAHTRQNSEISIHAPREGSDRPVSGFDIGISQFLSTLPARGATKQTA